MTAVQNSESKLQKLESKISKLKIERASLGEEYSKLSEKLSANFKLLQKLSEEAADIRFEEQKASGSFDWNMLLAYESGEGNYKAKNKALRTLFPEEHVRSDGYFPDNMQYALQIRLDKSSASQLDYINDIMVNQIIPVIKPVEERKTYRGRVIKLMEPGLSEFGSHYISVLDDRVELQVTRYSHTSTVHTATTFREMLEFLQKNYAFAPSDDGDNDD